MLFSVTFFIVIFLCLIIYRLITLRTAHNKIYLSFLIGHIALIVLICCIGILAQLFEFSTVINILLKLLSLIFLFIFSQAIFLNTYPKVPKVIILIFLSSLALFVLNFLGYRFFQPVKSNIIFGYQIDTFLILYRDAVIFTCASCVTIWVIMAYKFRTALKLIKQQTKHSKLVIKFLTFYFYIIIFNFLFLISCQILFNNNGSGEIPANIGRMLLMIEVLFFYIQPRFLNSLAKLNFPMLMSSNLTDDNEGLKHITKILTSKKLFLDPEFSLAKMQLHSKLSAEKIRSFIKTSNFKNFKNFINHHRIEYAVVLIDRGYLDKHTINSLSIDSGFKSPVTFFRSFKDINKKTPLNYSNGVESFVELNKNVGSENKKHKLID